METRSAFRSQKLLACLLALALFIPFVSTAALAQTTEEATSFQEPYMEDAVRKSLIQKHGLAFAFMVQDESFNIMDHVGDVTSLDLSNFGITELRDLSLFPRLNSLNLGGNPIKDISVLDGHKALRGLGLANTQVEHLPDLPALEALVLDGNQAISDFTQVEQYRERLQRLSVSDTKIAALPNLPNLEMLWCANTEISDISFLGNAKNLLVFEAEHTNITDFSPLAGVTTLTTLCFGSEDKPITQEMIDIISENRMLTELMVWGTEISSIGWLANLQSLQELSICGPALNQEEAASILPKLSSLEALKLERSGFAEIGFLESMTGLSVLVLTDMGIEDIAPIKKLTKLYALSVNDNQINDLTPLSGLTDMKTLTAENNQIDSLKPLAKLKSLQHLNLPGNQITDVSPLSNLKELTFLKLSSNLIEDVSSLSKLSLSTAEFFDNPIKDEAKAKKAIPSILLGSLEVYQRSNGPFYFEDARVQQAFENALLTYHSDIYQAGKDTTYLMAQACSQLDFSGLGLTELPDLSAFTGLQSLNLDGNEISDISQIKDMTLQGFMCDSAALVDWSPLYSQTELLVLSMMDATHQLTPEDIQFIGQNQQLTGLWLSGKGEIDLTPLAGLTSLQMAYLNIEGSCDFTSLKGLKKLESLVLDLSDGTEATGLSSLPGVKELNLGCHGALDLSIVSGLKKLSKLTIQGAVIEDFTPLQKNSALKELWLEENTFASDQLAALTKLKKLSTLAITATSLEDISFLSSLKSLTGLIMDSCEISNIEPIGKLTKLTELSLSHNQIRDISPLASLTKLMILKLNNNQIESVESLAKLKKLTGLNVSNNRITDLSPIEALSLEQLIAEGNDLSSQSTAPKESEAPSDEPVYGNASNDVQMPWNLSVKTTANGFAKAIEENTGVHAQLDSASVSTLKTFQFMGFECYIAAFFQEDGSLRRLRMQPSVGANRDDIGGRAQFFDKLLDTLTSEYGTPRMVRTSVFDGKGQYIYSNVPKQGQEINYDLILQQAAESEWGLSIEAIWGNVGIALSVNFPSGQQIADVDWLYLPEVIDINTPGWS